MKRKSNAMIRVNNSKHFPLLFIIMGISQFTKRF